ncbi:MAG: peptide ABC transporter substrate-binding protein [Fusicatenibacter sp.]
MYKKSKVLALVLTGAMMAGCLAACGGDTGSTASGSSTANTASTSESSVSESSTSESAASDTTTTGGDTQVLNLRVSSFGNNYDVQDMGWRWMMADCYEGLYRNVADENGETFILAGAESVDVSDDQLVYTFHLRQDAKWSDGVPVTAHDYEYGWKRLLDPSIGYDYASFIFNVVGAEEYYNGTGSADDVMAKALDDYTFEVTLKIADPTFTAKLVATPLYPTRQDIAEAAGDNWGKDWTLCVYNGPYCMSELVEDNKMVWTKNTEYWDAENTHLDAINWYLVAEDSTAATMFDNGELDVLQTSGDYSVKYKGEAEAGNVQLNTSDYPGTVYLAFNFTTGGSSGLMSNAKIRKALSYAVNREEMISAVYGRYKPAYGLISPAITFDGSSYRSQSEEPLTAEYQEYAGNAEKLQALFQEGLDELGVTTPLSDITVTYLSYGSTMENQTEREYLQQIWQQMLGIKVELNTVGDYSLFKAERDAGNYDIMNSGWWSDYNDPLDYLDVFYSGIYSSTGGYSNAEYDALLDSLDGEGDNAKRFEIYEQAENLLLVEDCGLIPIYYTTKEYFLQNWVKDFRTSSFGASQELYITYIEGRGN